MKKLFFVLSLFLIGCGSSKINYDFDRSLDFKQFTSYNYYPDMETGMSELDDKRLLYQLDSVLQSRGMEKTNTPDLYLNIKTTQFEGQSPFSLNIGLGSVGRRGGVGVSGGTPIGAVSLFEVIFFDLIDVERNELIWQARSEKRVPYETTPLNRERYFAMIVSKVFEKFPPK